MTRDVNPNIEGIMQHLVLSPDNKWAAAYTNNNQTILLNMLSSEFTIIDNPLLNEEPVRGVWLLNKNLFIHGDSSWVRFDMRGNKEEYFESGMDPTEWPILCRFFLLFLYHFMQYENIFKFLQMQKLEWIFTVIKVYYGKKTHFQQLNIQTKWNTASFTGRGI